MESTLAAGGYPALFLVSFLAATMLPLGSEWLLALQVATGGNPVALVVVATVGNLLGALTTYWIGLRGGQWLIRRGLRISPDQQERAERTFRRYGVWSLLLSWLPVIGDPLCLMGGIMRISLPLFTLLVAIGKGARYATLAWLTLAGKSTVLGSHWPDLSLIVQGVSC
jgi:membrane protein YqaA with SNARE-associated domain